MTPSPLLINVDATYLARFPAPSDDGLPPVISNVPATIAVEATSQAGAPVWYPIPTATDTSNQGVNVECFPRANATFPLGTTTVACSASDVFGHMSTAQFNVIVHDTHGPIFTNIPANITTPANGNGNYGTASFTPPTATDQVDGVRPVTCTPGSGSVFQLGTTTVTCTSADHLGNTASVSFTVTITEVFQWSGVLQPINSDGSSVFKQGSTIAVKFVLTGPSAGITNLTATLSVALISNNVAGPVNEATSTSTADSGNTFRYDAASGQYIFNLSTKKMTVGTWQLIINLGDGALHTVNISLR
jgi:hypothetical protein